MGLVGIILAAAVSTTASPGGEAVAFRNVDVLVVDSADRPLFRSSRDYLLREAQNPTGQVVRYDPVARRVLLSTAGPEYWVRCAELMPMQASCPATPAKPATRSIRIPRSTEPNGPEHASRGLPACPGDPRCPKSD